MREKEVWKGLREDILLSDEQINELLEGWSLFIDKFNELKVKKNIQEDIKKNREKIENLEWLLEVSELQDDDLNLNPTSDDFNPIY